MTIPYPKPTLTALIGCLEAAHRLARALLVADNCAATNRLYDYVGAALAIAQQLADPSED